MGEMMNHPIRAFAAVTALGLVVTATLLTVRDQDGAGGAAAPSRSTGKANSVSLGRTQTVSLTTASNCDDLLAYYKREADRVVGPYGLNGNRLYGFGGMAGVNTLSEADAARTSAGAAVVPQAQASGPAAPDTSTNVQVAGVDESDVVKTRGDIMVSTVDGAVRITRLAGKDTRTLATWRPSGSSANSVLLDGTAAVVVGYAIRSQIVHPLPADAKAESGAASSAEGSSAEGSSAAGSSTEGSTAAEVSPGPGTTRLMMPFGPAPEAGTVLTVLDLADPAHPRAVRQLEITGTSNGDVRLVDGELRLAVSSDAHGLTWKTPSYPPNTNVTPKSFQSAEKKATAANRRLIDGSTIADWLPQATVTPLDAAGKPDGAPVTKPLLDCSKVAVPNSFSGLQTLSLVASDLRVSTPLTDWRAAGVVASGSTLYATADHAWIATSTWARPVQTPQPATKDQNNLVVPEPDFAPVTSSTQLHLFDTPLRSDPRYVASGQIDGMLLSQFSMDERDGMLRVASTTEATATPAAGEKETEPVIKTEGRISVLRPDGKTLNRVGLITGLGAGERIRGVRFDGTTGYVVTYKQTDPLYTVDLSDPEHPALKGELKMPGYSAYLHPAGTGRLLGLGQDGTRSGQTTGLQLSLFDVQNLAQPTRLDQQKLSGAWSDAESDHHAFTLAGDLVLIPYSSWISDPKPHNGSYGERFDAGVIAVRVGAGTLSAPSVLRPIADSELRTSNTGKSSATFQKVTQATPMRTVVQAGVIYTVTPTGIAAHNSTDFDRLTFAPFSS
jgi:hypothetical protein